MSSSADLLRAANMPAIIWHAVATDATLEHGQAFTVTRDGRSIGELVPLRQRRRFVSRAEFVAMSRTAPAIDTDAFRADQDAAADQARGAYDQ